MTSRKKRRDCDVGRRDTAACPRNLLNSKRCVPFFNMQNRHRNVVVRYSGLAFQHFRRRWHFIRCIVWCASIEALWDVYS